MFNKWSIKKGHEQVIHREIKVMPFKPENVPKPRANPGRERSGSYEEQLHTT